MYSIGQHVTAIDPEGRLARGEIVSRARAVNGDILYYEVKNAISGIHQIVSPDIYSIRLGLCEIS